MAEADPRRAEVRKVYAEKFVGWATARPDDPTLEKRAEKYRELMTAN